MKKTPQSDELHSGEALSSSSEPVLPGTEEPRSLGDMLLEAERTRRREAREAAAEAGKAPETAGDASSKGDAGKGVAGKGDADKSGTGKGGSQPRRQKKVSRAQQRRYARERALQALYQWDVSTGQSSDVQRQFMDAQDMSRVDVSYFVQLFNGVSHNPQKIDDVLVQALDRPLEDLDPIERGVLRIATYELTVCLETPARVIINEGIEITKRFGADKGHRYVNGVLDKLAVSVRPLEMKRR